MVDALVRNCRIPVQRFWTSFARDFGIFYYLKLYSYVTIEQSVKYGIKAMPLPRLALVAIHGTFWLGYNGEAIPGGKLVERRFCPEISGCQSRRGAPRK